MQKNSDRYPASEKITAIKGEETGNVVIYG